MPADIDAQNAHGKGNPQANQDPAKQQSKRLLKPQDQHQPDRAANYKQAKQAMQTALNQTLCQFGLLGCLHADEFIQKNKLYFR